MDPSGPQETICAPATGLGKAGVAVIRLSGAGVRAAVRAVAGAVPPVREMALRTLRDPRSGEAIDRGLVVFFAAPASFTGEDVAELHIHGGRAVLAAVLAALTETGLARLAAPGEFTRRAFFNGKLDLTEVEGLADLVEAETQAQRRQALSQMGGSLARLYDGWRRQLIRAGGLLEAAIDFPDEDMPGGVTDEAVALIEALRRDLHCHLEDGVRGERLRTGLVVALVGPPNAGKSTLLNALAKRDVAIVSEEPGTTRDVLEVHLDLAGYPVTLLDLAGLREGTGRIEQEGIRRARDRAAAADIRLFVSDGTGGGPLPDFAALEVSWQEGDLVAVSKADLCAAPQSDIADFLRFSAVTGEGLPALIAAIAERAKTLMSGAETGVLSRERHRRCVAEAENCLAQAAAAAPLGAELAAENLRLAARALGRLGGRIDVEDLLDVIFAEFCLGK